MIVKSREMPELLEILPRLINRLPTEHPAHEKAFQHHRSIRAGFSGEQLIDESLERIQWNMPAFLLYDLNIETGLTRCQIDTLVLTPYYALVLEIKNFSGTLIFQEKSFQMTRVTREGIEEGFDSPVAQLQRATREVEFLLSEIGLTLPIFSAIVLPYPRTLVKGVPGIPVVFTKSLPLFISGLPTSYPPIDETALRRTAEKFTSLHLPFYPTDFRKRYGFQLEDFRTGVICSGCRRVAMRKSSRLHQCQYCKLDIHDGYIQALCDWRHFISPIIKSSECQKFLRLPDKYATYYILKNTAERIEYGRWRIKDF